MKREFISTATFDKCWKALNLTDDDFRALQNYLLLNPQAGDIIKGTGGITKIRWSLPHRGKSGGIRVLFIDFISHEKTIFINCYPKSEKDNITDEEKAMYKSFIKEIEKELGR